MVQMIAVRVTTVHEKLEGRSNRNEAHTEAAKKLGS